MSPKRQEQSQGRQPRFLIYCQKLALLITQLLLPAICAVWLRAALFRANRPRTHPGFAGLLAALRLGAPSPRAVPQTGTGRGAAGHVHPPPWRLAGVEFCFSDKKGRGWEHQNQAALLLSLLFLCLVTLGASTPAPGWLGAGPSTAHAWGSLRVQLWSHQLSSLAPMLISRSGQHGQAAKPCSAPVTHSSSHRESHRSWQALTAQRQVVAGKRCCSIFRRNCSLANPCRTRPVRLKHTLAHVWGLMLSAKGLHVRGRCCGVGAVTINSVLSPVQRNERMPCP